MLLAEGTAATHDVAPTLVDSPISSEIAPLFLDGTSWIATNEGGPATEPLAATVPGDIITDLQRALRVKDPYWNTTWRDPIFIEQWNSGVWERKEAGVCVVHGKAALKQASARH